MIKNLSLRKTLVRALKARSRHLLSVCKLTYKKGSQQYQDIHDTVDFLEKLTKCFNECESFSIHFNYPDGDIVNV